ncbi:complement C1q-like protein 3 [Pecten maximus]|uniref:complement C1q-like protein 3 n=1 Tax=Pecten maximus TaxID=6579 RepID=UPI001458B604|nr:complement C1q-like protein 3 [Pecten maximus]
MNQLQLKRTNQSMAHQASSISSDEKRRIQSGHHRITRVSPKEDVVAFHAILAHQISDPSNNHVVKYNHVITNAGGAHYNSDTGIFTCTQTGVYVFSWSIFVEGHHFIFTDLVRNNAVIGSAQTGQDTGFSIAGSATVTVHLEVGDVVWVLVNRHGSGSDIQPYLSMFTGFRL